IPPHFLSPHLCFKNCMAIVLPDAVVFPLPVAPYIEVPLTASSTVQTSCGLSENRSKIFCLQSFMVFYFPLVGVLVGVLACFVGLGACCNLLSSCFIWFAFAWVGLGAACCLF